MKNIKNSTGLVNTVPLQQYRTDLHAPQTSNLSPALRERTSLSVVPQLAQIVELIGDSDACVVVGWTVDR